MRQKYLSAFVLAATVTASAYAAASGWDFALEATESVKNRTLKPAAQMPVEGVISSKFGMRQHPITDEVKVHKGIDIAAPEGTDFYATTVGRVTYAGHAGSLGLMVEVKGLDGSITRFGHASELNVKTGDRIHKGAVLGRVGSTGLSTGSHLHYELLIDGVNVNPQSKNIAGLIAKTQPVKSSESPQPNAAEEDKHNELLIASIAKTYAPQIAIAKERHKSELSVARLIPFKASQIRPPKPSQLKTDIEPVIIFEIDLYSLQDSVQQFTKEAARV